MRQKNWRLIICGTVFCGRRDGLFLGHGRRNAAIDRPCRNDARGWTGFRLRCGRRLSVGGCRASGVAGPVEEALIVADKRAPRPFLAIAATADAPVEELVESVADRSLVPSAHVAKGVVRESRADARGDLGCVREGSGRGLFEYTHTRPLQRRLPAPFRKNARPCGIGAWRACSKSYTPIGHRSSPRRSLAITSLRATARTPLAATLRRCGDPSASARWTRRTR